MSYGIKVSKPGYNVLTETDPRNLVFDSSLNHLKTAGSGSFQRTLNNASTTDVTVAHGLGYPPLIVGYYRNTGNGRWFVTMSQPTSYSQLKRSLISMNVSVSVDSTNIYFHLQNDNGNTQTIEVQYEFFYEGN